MTHPIPWPPSAAHATTLLILLLLPAAASAQDATSNQDRLESALAAERAAREALQRRVDAWDAERARIAADDDIEAQLRALIAPDGFAEAASRTSFPSAFNPRIGVYSDAVADFGNVEERLGWSESDRFSLREVEVDLRLPFSPWGEGVLVTAFEDLGSGEFETKVEEGYANVAMGGLFGNDSDVTGKLGRFRVPFGHDNVLHTHDLLQTDRPFAVQNLLGNEGLVGDGIGATIPMHHTDTDDGFGRTTTAKVAVVNGEMFTGEEGLLGEIASGSGVALGSDSPVMVGRVAHYAELSSLSDLELGASVITSLGGEAIETDGGTEIEPDVLGFDVTLRTRDDETGVGGWLVRAETIRTEFDYDDTAVGGFPTGREDANGWWVTVQRQMSPITYVGLRTGRADVLGSPGESIRDLSPYVSFYADEFFRVRLQGQLLDHEAVTGESTDASRMFLQFTWNFGAHQPHPYWTNR